MLLLSRLWFERWATMFEVSYHTGTNKSSRVLLDFDDGAGPIPVQDSRGTLTMGLASQVWLGKRKRWSLDAEYLQPIPDGGTPNTFYTRGGGVVNDNPFNEFNFDLGFNLVRQFTLGKNAAHWKKQRQVKNSGKAAQ